MPKDRINEAAWSDKYKHWTIKVQRDGQRKSFYSSTPGRRGKLEAERKADAWLKKEPTTEKPAVLFRDLRDGYLADLGTDNGSAHKDKEASIIKNWLTPWWENKPVAELTQQDYKDAVRRPAETDPPHSARTCGHVRSTITALWYYAADNAIPMAQPITRRIKIPATATRGQRRVLTEDDVRVLFDPANDDYFYIHAFRLLVLLGLRSGELCGLQREDRQGNILTVNRSINASQEETAGKTKSARRSILLPEAAVKVLDDQSAMLKKKGIISPWLFPTTHGEGIHPKLIYTAWCSLRKKIGVTDISVHELRHTMISEMKSDIPLPVLQSVVGHTANMDTLGTYGHTADSDRQQAAAAIDKVHNRILNNS
ncbi:MAG: site-specific integrase [Firmicutes bacterium]|nr:site-specific integrase [Bacillota bacterium]MBQ1501910.1 site-specific integrase [Bacillota bacterium]